MFLVLVTLLGMLQPLHANPEPLDIHLDLRDLQSGINERKKFVWGLISFHFKRLHVIQHLLNTQNGTCLPNCFGNEPEQQKRN